MRTYTYQMSSAILTTSLVVIVAAVAIQITALSPNSPPTTSLLSATQVYSRSFLKAKTVLITGPTSGLGLQVINELALLPAFDRPKKVVLLARSKVKAEAAAAKLSEANIEAPIVLGDLGSSAACFRMVEEAKVALAGDGLSVMVINAG